MKTSKWVRDEWVQADMRAPADDAQCECRSAKQQETRFWNRTVFVPKGMQPLDIIRAYPYKLPLPPFQAGQHTLNKRDVECIASALVDPNLRWRNMCHFMVAAFEGPGTNRSIGNKLGFDPDDCVGDYVLLSGHHRFLALLVCGLPPSELPPTLVRKAPLAVPYVFPWPTVVWGK